MNRMTLSHFLSDCQQRVSAPESLLKLIASVAFACQQISQIVNKGALEGVLGSAGRHNIQGEEQQKLDVLANHLILEISQNSACLAAMASEEMDKPYVMTEARLKGEYLLVFDPLDGSSNIDINLSVGTIFSILKPLEIAAAVDERDFYQAGHRQMAAGYALYGPQTMLVLTLGDGVHGFTLDRTPGEFVLTHPRLHIPPTTQEFAINMSNQRHWDAPVKRYIAELLAGRSGVRAMDFNMRWVASMVAEVHRILLRGGIFMYPHDARDPAKPGKLRLLYEANPMALIVEQAGGAVSNGFERMLEIVPQQLHERVAVFLGARTEVERVTAYHHQK